jgi:uncharacterized protein
MRIIRWNELIAVPWKNGHGITREIAKEPRGNSFAWRLSIADVAGNGPFSSFNGMRRVLTVVDGKGMELVGLNSTLQADLGVPVEFEGDMDITSRLKDGPLRDLNLIFDPIICSGVVSVMMAGERRRLQCRNEHVFALYCVAGSVDLDTSQQLCEGDTALVETGALDMKIAAWSSALLVTITRDF